MIGRIATALLALTLALILSAYFGDLRLGLSPGQAEFIGWRRGLSAEEAMRREVQWTASSSLLSERIGSALDRNDVDDAAMYADLARWAEISLGPDTMNRLASAQNMAADSFQDLSNYAPGFVFGSPTSFTAAAEGIASDTTVVGDVRDIAAEGNKLRKGEKFDDVILGLSVVGIAATTKSEPTEGGGAVIKSGVALLKLARRIETLTDEFSVRLKQMIAAAVDFKKLEQTIKDVDLGDLAKTQASVSQFSTTIEPEPLFPVLGDLDTICTNAGVGECMRLIAFVRVPNDLSELAEIATAAGPHARGIVELTGVRSAGAFKSSVHIFQFLGENLTTLIVWTCLLLILSGWRWFFPRREQKFQRIAVRPRQRRRH